METLLKWWRYSVSCHIFYLVALQKDDASDDDRETPSDEEKAVSSEDEDNESKEHSELSDGDVEMREWIEYNR